MKVNIRLSISEDKLGSSIVQYSEMVDLEHVTEDMIVNHIIPYMVRALLPLITKANKWTEIDPYDNKHVQSLLREQTLLRQQGQQYPGGVPK